MEALKQLSLEQIKTLSYEQIHDLLKSKSVYESEIENKNIDRLIEYVNNFFKNCVSIFDDSKNNNPYAYGALGLDNIQDIKMNVTPTDFIAHKKFRKIINKTISATSMMKQIINLYTTINQKLYIMFVPIKNISDSENMLRNHILPNKIKLECSCASNISSADYELLRKNKAMVYGGYVSSCSQKNCYYIYNNNGAYTKTNIEAQCQVNKGYNDIKQSYSVRGYNLYTGSDFIVLTRKQIIEKYGIENIDEFVIDPANQEFTTDNHVEDYLIYKHELRKYRLPWHIFDLTVAEDIKVCDFTQYFNFIDMVELREYLECV